jgi:hypothetical protein
MSLQLVKQNFMSIFGANWEKVPFQMTLIYTIPVQPCRNLDSTVLTAGIARPLDEF